MKRNSYNTMRLAHAARDILEILPSGSITTAQRIALLKLLRDVSFNYFQRGQGEGTGRASRIIHNALTQINFGSLEYEHDPADPECLCEACEDRREGHGYELKGFYTPDSK